MSKVSLDIETLGVDTDAVILSIGACVVENPQQCFYIEIDLHQKGRTIDPNTLQWWLETNPVELRRVVVRGEIPLEEALDHLSKWLSFVKFKEIWANSPSFDLAILRHAYKSFDMEVPWEYYMERDLRTLKSLLPKEAIPKSRKELKHNALYDAKYQAEIIGAYK